MKTQNPWMGRAKGSAGNMTASKVYDKNVLKAKAFEVTNPKTAAQQNQRTFFKEVSDLVNQLTEEQCRFLCPKAPKGMSRRNFLSKQLASNVTTSSNQKVVDLANIKTIGNAKETDMPIVDVDVTEEAIQFEWDDSQEYAQKHENDYPSFFVINVTKKEILLLNSNVKMNAAATYVNNTVGWQGTDNFNCLMLNSQSKTALTGFGSTAVVDRPAR